MEIRYTINRQNDTAVLKSARKVNSEAYIVPPSTATYTVKVDGESDTELLSAPTSALFVDSRGNSFAETTIYQRVPWASNAKSVLISQNNQIIGEFDMTDTDSDGEVDDLDIDDDNDGFNDSIELFMGTNATLKCSLTSTANDEPVDAIGFK